MHGSGKNATVEWSDSADAADATLLAKFEKVRPEGPHRPLPQEPEALGGPRALDGEAPRRGRRGARGRGPGDRVRDRGPRREGPRRRPRGATSSGTSSRGPLALLAAPHGPHDARAGSRDPRPGEAGRGSGRSSRSGSSRRRTSRTIELDRPEARRDRPRDARADARQAPQEPALGPARLRLVRAALRDGRRVPGAPQPERPRRGSSTRSRGRSSAACARRCARCSTAPASSPAGS